MSNECYFSQDLNTCMGMISAGRACPPSSITNSDILIIVGSQLLNLLGIHDSQFSVAPLIIYIKSSDIQHGYDVIK